MMPALCCLLGGGQRGDQCLDFCSPEPDPDLVVAFAFMETLVQLLGPQQVGHLQVPRHLRPVARRAQPGMLVILQQVLRGLQRAGFIGFLGLGTHAHPPIVLGVGDQAIDASTPIRGVN
jgi:hypothetical protein